MSDNNKLWMPDQDVMVHNLTAIIGTLELPQNYLVLDLETTTPEVRSGHIWQIGFYRVLDGQPLDEKGMSMCLAYPTGVLKQAVFEIGRRAVKLSGDSTRSWETRGDTVYQDAERQFVEEVTVKGAPPEEMLRLATETIRASVDAGHLLVGQNVSKFDVPFLEWACRRTGINLEFPARKLIDVGMLVKAGKLRRRILDRETPKAFYARVSEERARGCFYAIERFLIPAYGLAEKYGVDTAQAHDAGYDCWITSLALQEIIEAAKHYVQEPDHGNK